MQHRLEASVTCLNSVAQGQLALSPLFELHRSTGYRTTGFVLFLLNSSRPLSQIGHYYYPPYTADH
jgi:hypothetical protein